MFIKIAMLFVFFAVTVGIGLYCRRTATDVNGFVLGGRSVGPWLTAFAYGLQQVSLRLYGTAAVAIGAFGVSGGLVVLIALFLLWITVGFRL